jgi:hypothetical protein
MDAHLLDQFAALPAAAAVRSDPRVGTGGCYAALYDQSSWPSQVTNLDQFLEGSVRMRWHARLA